MHVTNAADYYGNYLKIAKLSKMFNNLQSPQTIQEYNTLRDLYSAVVL